MKILRGAGIDPKLLFGRRMGASDLPNVQWSLVGPQLRHEGGHWANLLRQPAVSTVASFCCRLVALRGFMNAIWPVELCPCPVRLQGISRSPNAPLQTLFSLGYRVRGP
jgi:hypothetical protein